MMDAMSSLAHGADVNWRNPEADGEGVHVRFQLKSSGLSVYLFKFFGKMGITFIPSIYILLILTY